MGIPIFDKIFCTMNFVEELQWRGMIHDVMPGTEAELNKGVTSGYIGFDPTADSLHIGSLVQIMILVHFQRCGHKPYALVGGATGMVGDPSGKADERNLLGEEVLNKNVAGVKKQLEQFLDFDCGENSAEMVNNYDWFKDFSFLDFIRDAGKHITVSYMMAKDSVQKRLQTGLSFTEFSYQLVQGYDFYHLWKEKNCKIQMGGSDQWGNIVTGTEFIRRKAQGEAFALTTPLITKADGTKFGKSEGGNVWLDATRTSPYQFHQYWLNASDEDVKKYIRIFTLLSKDEIEALEAKHAEAPHERALQNALADEVTIRVHSEQALEDAKTAASILHSKGQQAIEAIQGASADVLMQAFQGVPQTEIKRSDLVDGINIIDFLSETTGFLSSKGEARRELKANSIAVNKEKVNDAFAVSADQIIADRYILLSKGRKNNFLVILS
jgi:tyrosyl-tRNA synthetase